MGVLKLSVIEEHEKSLRGKMKVVSKSKNPYRISNCGCPCECFIKKGEVVMDDIQSTASWNID